MLDLEVDDVVGEVRHVSTGVVAKPSRNIHFQHAADTDIIPAQDRGRRKQVRILLGSEPDGDDLHAEVAIGD